MTRESYIRMTDATRAILARLPGGPRITRLPTLLCAAVYLGALAYLMLMQDIRLLRALLVPAVCFIVCTALRPLIGRQRPYDRFDAVPVGSFVRGKGKSMPSRHTASAAAIAAAIVYIFPCVPVMIAMILLTLAIASLRVLCGKHYPSDVIAAVALSAAISAAGYML